MSSCCQNREHLERQSKLETQLAIQDVERRYVDEMKRMSEEKEKLWNERAEFTVAEMASELEAEREARKSTEAEMRNLHESFQHDWEARLESAVEDSVMEGAKSAESRAKPCRS